MRMLKLCRMTTASFRSLLTCRWRVCRITILQKWCGVGNALGTGEKSQRSRTPDKPADKSYLSSNLPSSSSPPLCSSWHTEPLQIVAPVAADVAAAPGIARGTQDHAIIRILICPDATMIHGLERQNPTVTQTIINLTSLRSD